MKQLRKDLQDANMSIPLGRQLKLADLQALAQQHSLEITTEKRKILLGWEGKPKGILQILWERGLIVGSDYKGMTLDGRKDPVTGLIQPGSSLRQLLAECSDFKEELSALQVLRRDLGVLADSLPKYHAELAVEGIEYSWGYAKGMYCHTPLSQKKGKTNFLRLVHECCDTVEHLTLERVRVMAKRARAYICTYYHLAQQNNIPLDAGTEQETHQNHQDIAQEQKLLFEQIENLAKEFRTHRCALDFDKRFLSSLFRIKEEDAA